jgi:hypothetical protein
MPDHPNQTVRRLSAPLFTSWTPQLVRIPLPEMRGVGELRLTIDGEESLCQWDGRNEAGEPVVLCRLGFAAGQTRELHFQERGDPPAICVELPFDEGREIGAAGLVVSPDGPWMGFAGHRMECVMEGVGRPLSASLQQLSDGPLFSDYRVVYDFGEGRRYNIRLRCHKLERWVEVDESFSLQFGASLRWTLNPDLRFTHIVSRDSFINETGPTVEPLNAQRPRDLLCRLQMPVLTEYFIPNNRGWFAFTDERNPSAGMVGILGLYGARWEEPVQSMPELYAEGGRVEWRASLVSGRRHWLLLHAPLETEVPESGRFLFHRLHSEFNSLRLDEHLELTGDALFDRTTWQGSAFFEANKVRDGVAYRCANLSPVRRCHEMLTARPLAELTLQERLFLALVKPSADTSAAIIQSMEERFALWVREFQGWRRGVHDYEKSVIGFSRMLRAMLLAYEMLRKDGALSDEQIARFNAWFGFAAKRITDEGRWPHGRTWKHPDHPESVRDFYTYGGEHKPDRLVWTNSLPNFQSDPQAALAHLACVFPGHPDAPQWLRSGVDEIERQLNAYCGPDGAWEESINYALFTTSYLVTTFRALKGRYGMDYFQDSRMRRMISWLCRFFGPHDKRFGCHTWPAVGNAILPQNQVQYLLAYAAELEPNDPLRLEILAIFQRVENDCRLEDHHGHFLAVLAAMAPEVPEARQPLARLGSESMAEVGVSMRHRHTEPDESYLFQKIGFAKDHYENDESAFNWYAKGTPFCMDYGTYTPDAAVGGAHNVVEIPDEDSLRRGFLAGRFFSGTVDYTRCEIPVTLKLSWGRMRNFEEVQAQNGKVHRDKIPYFYIGDQNPVGPKVWKVRQLLFVKPDYVVLSDRVFGRVPHRWNLHFTGGPISQDGMFLRAQGRFDLDLLACVAEPSVFRFEGGELVPKLRERPEDDPDRHKHAQHFCRIYHPDGERYRVLIFAKEPDRGVTITPIGGVGFRVTTPGYEDLVFLSDEFTTASGEGWAFAGKAGWIRRWADGRVEAAVPDGEWIAGFGLEVSGRGPWTMMPGADPFPMDGPLRRISVTPAPDRAG